MGKMGPDEQWQVLNKHLLLMNEWCGVWPHSVAAAEN